MKGNEKLLLEFVDKLVLSKDGIMFENSISKHI
jgi:hypothetical protein